MSLKKLQSFIEDTELNPKILKYSVGEKSHSGDGRVYFKPDIVVLYDDDEDKKAILNLRVFNLETATGYDCYKYKETVFYPSHELQLYDCRESSLYALRGKRVSKVMISESVAKGITKEDCEDLVEPCVNIPSSVLNLSEHGVITVFRKQDGGGITEQEWTTYQLWE